MPEAIASFLSPVEHQAELQELIQQIAQAQLRLDVAEIIANNAEQVIDQATQGMIQVSPEFIEVARNILRYVTYALLSENTSALDLYLANLNETCAAQGFSIRSIAKTITLLKHFEIASVEQHHLESISSVLAELSTYFDRANCLLDTLPESCISELMTELNLMPSSTGRLQNLLERLGDLLDHSSQYVRLWLTSPHPDFGGKPPIFYLQQDKIEVVENLVEAIETGQIG
jgi:Phycobilisome protein/Protein of unknown function (DUF2384)